MTSVGSRSTRWFALGAWYPLLDATREMADGSLVACEAVHHPDQVAEAFRWRACEGEVLQIIERGRGARRMADAPQRVTVLTDIPLPLPVDELITTDMVRPRAEDRMLAQAGVALSNAEDAARAGLWSNGNALRVARHHERERHGYDWQPWAGLARVRYRRNANGAHWSTAAYDPTAVQDIEAWLAAKLGPVEIALLQMQGRDAPLEGFVIEPSAAADQLAIPPWIVDAAADFPARAPPDG